ncbi:hypothetical protein JOM56_012565 [Amanita muscaria]
MDAAIPGDSEYFLESYMISVIVEDTKFRLDSYFLQRESETLRGIIAASKADSIRLKGATVAEFRALWRYFYEGMYDDYKPSTTEWMDLLAIANTYGFTKVYRRAVYEIDDLFFFFFFVSIIPRRAAAHGRVSLCFTFALVPFSPTFPPFPLSSCRSICVCE